MSLAKNIFAMLLVTGSLWGCSLNQSQKEGQPGSLAGSNWLVESIDGKPVLTDSEITISFAEEGRVYGSSSCNRYNGGWHIQGQELEFTHMASTRMACPDSLMQQETRFLQVLNDVARYQVAGDGRLMLETSEGMTITAVASGKAE
ncbi:META domain-containing protein [Marinobacter fuscus]|uniref:META domain-containing protein n=1 Tax=Marinobacter fuscus TaxID=2109942 RepID=A0A2T1K5A2_9GAMM|nr:META domain-containing protein [Marinobacter fuscus]PSF05218.1 META domain-containing protein [Marinobacter fuscus]